MEHPDHRATDLDGDEPLEAELVAELEPAIAPAAGRAVGAVSPYVAAQPMRVSAEVLTADDPAGALAARFLLRHPKGTRRVYTTDLTHWFASAASSAPNRCTPRSTTPTPTPCSSAKNPSAAAGP